MQIGFVISVRSCCVLNSDKSCEQRTAFSLLLSKVSSRRIKMPGVSSESLERCGTDGAVGAEGSKRGLCAVVGSTGCEGLSTTGSERLILSPDSAGGSVTLGQPFSPECSSLYGEYLDVCGRGTKHRVSSWQMLFLFSVSAVWFP